VEGFSFHNEVGSSAIGCEWDERSSGGQGMCEIPWRRGVGHLGHTEYK
jgi:hypothetical protein